MGVDRGQRNTSQMNLYSPHFDLRSVQEDSVYVRTMNWPNYVTQGNSRPRGVHLALINDTVNQTAKIQHVCGIQQDCADQDFLRNRWPTNQF